jgi:hypothetical protein
MLFYARRMVDVLAVAEERLRETFGEPDARAAVTFLGAERVEVLRFLGPDANAVPLVRYCTLGMSRAPMADPLSPVADPVRGPRAELVLTLRADRVPSAVTDGVLRALAALAASPQVEGVVLAAGASLEVGAPLWPDAPFHAVLVGEPGGLVPDAPLPAPLDPVRFFPLLPMTPTESAWKRAKGAAGLQERWLASSTDLRDPLRASVPLT